MDFSGQYQFSDSQPYHHQFVPNPPPLTPSNSHSASDDFNTSPPNFDYIQGFSANVGPHPSSHAFPGPPTPPNPPNQSVYTGQQHQLRQGSFSNGVKPLPADMMGMGSLDLGLDDQSQTRGGSDDEDPLTPAQTRRKAQNRAAQRAFRERKERHVKDLEAKLADLEATQQQSSAENERLKREIQKISTENEILRATSQMSNGHASLSPEPTTTVPMNFNPADFYSNVLQGHTNKTPSHRVIAADDGECLLAAGATWDFIIGHDLFKKGMVNIGDVSDRLKNCARCDGLGPVFSESAILAAIEQSVTSGTDDLL